VNTRKYEMPSGCICCGGAEHPTGSVALSRRKFLGAGVAAAVATATLAAPGNASAQSALLPEAALNALLAGNKRFVEQRLSSFDEDLGILKQNTVAKQQPFAAVLSCADSRVPVELIFDQSIGHLFVARVAGNIATPEIIASLEYGAAVLGTKAILVLGHANCGAVKATMEGKEVPGQISGLYAFLRPATDAAGGDLDAAIKANAKIQAHLLATASPLLAGMIRQERLKIAAGYYALDTGQVTLLS
jgi:carbonic anhydrase